jgi:hypothetical protein
MEKINMGLSDTVSLLGQASETGLQGVWNYRSDLGTKEWIRIIDESHGDIDILCYAMTFLPEDPNFNKILNRKIKEGSNVRILLGNPKGSNIVLRTQEEKTEGDISSRIDTSIAIG